MNPGAPAPSHCVLVTAGKGESRVCLGSDTATAPGDLYSVIRMMRGAKPMPPLAFHRGLIHGSRVALPAVCCSLLEIGEEALKWSLITEGDPSSLGKHQGADQLLG